MKKIIYILSALFIAMVALSSCAKTDDNVEPKEPVVEEPTAPADDVTSDFVDEGFKQYMLDEFDENEDGYITKAECEKVKAIWVRETIYTVYDIKGIEHCKNVESLEILRNNLSGEIDLSGFEKLTYVSFMENMGLTKVIVKRGVTLDLAWCDAEYCFVD